MAGMRGGENLIEGGRRMTENETGDSRRGKKHAPTSKTTEREENTFWC